MSSMRYEIKGWCGCRKPVYISAEPVGKHGFITYATCLCDTEIMQKDAAEKLVEEREKISAQRLGISRPS